MIISFLKNFMSQMLRIVTSQGQIVGKCIKVQSPKLCKFCKTVHRNNKLGLSIVEGIFERER